MGSSLYVTNFLLALLVMVSFFHLISTTQSSSSKKPSCRGDERSYLFQFNQSFSFADFASGGPNAYPKTASWKMTENNSDCCLWDGVECDNDTGYVIGLDLTSSFLYGSINSSSSLFRLVHLQKLNLGDNDFNYSQIPSGIRQLSRLTYLNLSWSAFSGQVPLEISLLSNLASLDLTFNYDSTQRSFLKVEKLIFNRLIQNLTNLEELYLSWVNISSAVPNILANLSSLRTLVLQNCELQGQFPADIFLLPNLKRLSVRSNEHLTGQLPEFNISSPLMSIELVGTSFSGELPDSISNLSFLNVLDINGCSFSGSVPSSLGKLAQLEYLDLSYNFFNSCTLNWLGKQTKLHYLGLQETMLTGTIPSSLQNLTKLVYLNLYHNQLTGQIPPRLANLTQLTDLVLSRNRLEGPIPESISKLMNLEVVSLDWNNLSGTVELDTFLNLKNLIKIELSYNKLSVVTSTSVNATLPRFQSVGLARCNLIEFPDFLQHQNKLQWLTLSRNKIWGQVPDWLFNIGKDTLLYLSLFDNYLQGLFGQPQVVLPWTRLNVLDLESNMLQGSLPIPQPSILSYSVSTNSFAGEVSPIICNLSSLSVLDLSNNKLSGIIPQCLGNFSNSLLVLNLRNNRFHGSIPQTYLDGSKLRMIDLSQNKLNGSLPRSLVNCAVLEILDIGNNQVSDIFPSWMGTLPELAVLFLRSNRLHGAIGSPKNNSDFPKLRILDISSNSFTGALPSEYIDKWHAMKNFKTEEDFKYMEATMYLSMPAIALYNIYRYSMIITYKGTETIYKNIPDIFRAIDLSSNRFEGGIPESIGNLQGLQLLNLSNNILTGQIPSFLGNLTELESLDLSQNKLNGKIPNQLAELTFLAVLNLSYNHLTGPIPRGKQFDTFQNNSFQGNLGLCGNPLSKNCGNAETPTPLPPSTLDEDEDSKFPSGYDWIFIVAGYGSGLVVGLVIGQKLTRWKHEWFIQTFGRRREDRGK